MIVEISDAKEHCRVVLCEDSRDGYVAVLDFRRYSFTDPTTEFQGRVRLNRRQCVRLLEELQRIVDPPPNEAASPGSDAPGGD